VSIARRTLKEAGGKTLPPSIRTISGITDGMRPPNKSKSKDYTDIGGKYGGDME